MKPDNRLNNKNHDNRGIAMVSVMIVLTVCMLIATIVLQITYTSLLSRRVNSQASSNFYAAESTIDDIQSVLQSIAVYSTDKLATTTGKEFVDIAQEVLYSNAGVDASMSEADKNQKISEYLFNNLHEDYKKILGTEVVDGDGNKNYIYDSNNFKVTAVTKKEGEGTAVKGTLTLSIELTYEDEKGYMTSISTDLVLNDVIKRKSASSYSLGSYSMFTGGGVNFEGNDSSANQRPVFVQEGNCYVGTQGAAAPKAMGISGAVVYLTGATIINGDVYIQNGSALNFTAGKDEAGVRTEITIRGTVYIDKTSSLIVNENIDFLCEDIVLVDGTSEYSVFDGTKPWISYDDSASSEHYYSLYPYQTDELSGLKQAGSTNVNGTVDSKFDSGATGGTVFISKDDNAYPAKYDGTSWIAVDNGSEFETEALINKSAVCVPQAKATIWTYDGKQVNVDAEMTNFVNCQVLNFQATAPNTGIHAQYPQIIGHEEGSSVSKGGISTNFGGAPVTNVTNITSSYGTTTSEFLASGAMTGSLTNNQSGTLSFSGMSNLGYSSLLLGSNNLDSICFRVGHIQDCAENLGNSTNNMAIVCVWGAYTIQMNGGSVVGIVMSADCCTYKVQGRLVTTCYSVLNAADDSTEAAKTKMDTLFDELQYLSFWRPNNSTQFNYNGTSFYDDYQLTLLDSLFVGGMKSFTSDGGGSVGGDAYVDTDNMYDFITMENWQANK